MESYDLVDGFGNLIRALRGETPTERMIRNIDNVFDHLDKRWALANEEVRGLLGAERYIDEMALYFGANENLFTFMAKAVQRGWEVFNQAQDVVETSPIVSDYGVVYWFLRNQSRQYRLELMQLKDGFSPYHGSLQEACERHDLPVVLAHASFKLPGEDQYASAGVALRNNDYELAQHCVSSYGKFSYYVNNERKDIPAIKPRINTRDGSNG